MSSTSTKAGKGTDWGFDAMDAEHGVEVALINAFRDAARDGKPVTEMAEILKRLSEFTALHFLSEELLMRLHSYPGYHAHCAQHALITEQLDEVGKQFAGRQVALAIETLNAWAVRLLAHIQDADGLVRDHLSAQGGPPP